MKIFQTSKAQILFVSVPEDDTQFEVQHNTLYCFKERLHCENCRILPHGQWQFLSLLKDADEEKAASVVDEIYRANDLVFYRDYNKHKPSETSLLFRKGKYYKDTALESLQSLANHLGCEGNQAILIEK